MSLLQNAANDGRLSAAAVLIEAGANVNFLGGSLDRSALHYAGYRNNLAMTELLLDSGADPNIAALDGERPLHTAAFAGDLPIIMALLREGADVTAKNGRGHTAMDVANFRAAERFQFAQRPFTEIADYLKEQMEAAALRAEAERAQRETVAHDLATLKSRRPERFRLKPGKA
jgi:ankyrin repeat protein